MTRRSRTVLLAPIAAVVLLAAGCTGTAEPAPVPDGPVETRAPEQELTVLAAGEDAEAESVAASAALFAGSPAAVVAPADDPVAQLGAASVAVHLGVPLLLDDGERGEEDPLLGELDRLDAGLVLALGVDGPSTDGAEAASAALGEGRDLTTLPLDRGRLQELLGDEVELVEAGGAPVAELAALEDGTALIDPATPEVGDDGSSRAPIPPLDGIEAGDALGGVTAVATEEAASLPAVATARAAGVPITVLAADAPNPQDSPDAIAALSAEDVTARLAIGPALAAERQLAWKIASAATGAQLPGGGQRMFPGHMMVAMYGTPGAPVLGILGEQDVEASVARAADYAAQYQPLTDRTVIPAFEIIATVASGSAGGDGNYSNELDAEAFVPWIEAAGAAGQYVVLDLQPGRTDFLEQAKALEPLLRYPWVGLALDPEWRLGPDQTHLVQIGSVGADEVNRVGDWLAELTVANDLPPKLFVLHQFRYSMLPDRERIVTDRPELETLVHVDGQGGQPAKQATWGALTQETEQQDFWWGWKNFIDEDQPMLNPQETMSQVSPTPDLITYQ